MDGSDAAGRSVGEGVISVIVADDDRMFSEALVEVIESAAQLHLVGLAEDAASAIALAERHQPDVAVLDVRMPGGGGEHAAREIRRRSPRTSIIALSAYADESGMAAAGACEHLLKGRVSGDEVIRAIREAAGRD